MIRSGLGTLQNKKGRDLVNLMALKRGKRERQNGGREVICAGGI